MRNLSKKTVNRLNKIMAYIEEEPKRLDMWQWGCIFDPKNKEVQRLVLEEGSVELNKVSDLPPCGTAACLAGTTVVLFASAKQMKKLIDIDRLSDWNPESKVYEVKNFDDSTPEVAADLLDINSEQASVLFYPHHWPYYPQEAYDAAAKLASPKARAKARYRATKTLIDAFIKLDGNLDNLFQHFDEEYLDGTD